MIYACVLIGNSGKHRWILLWNIFVEALLLLVLLLVLYGIDWPVAMLPQKSILDFSCYWVEFTSISYALEDLGQ